MFRIVFPSLLFVIVVSINGQSNNKRLLVGDPQDIQQELIRIQSELQLQQRKTETLQTAIQTLTIENTQLKTSISGNGGTVFTRWGREDCPENVTTLVYSGYAGGSHYSHSGGAAEYVCMPTDPIWGPHKDTPVYHGHAGYMYGAEYEEPTALFGVKNTLQDVPCAVCMTKQYSTTLMIPGRNECYTGWTEAYHGDLASGYYGHTAASQYVCVDSQPQVLETGSSVNQNGKLFYGVQSKCGPLPCPPYENGKFLTCVVCLV
ncbi:short-chain collagen C4-like [Pecten maximus]|uniref:short-chain collagen C4-like n=1 Tax=Pecten maximus TaxID=6579 RepID=UPI0014586278|nr:short-chain collagen C4-like [Pecten maximus]